MTDRWAIVIRQLMDPDDGKAGPAGYRPWRAGDTISLDLLCHDHRSLDAVRQCERRQYRRRLRSVRYQILRVRPYTGVAFRVEEVLK